MGLLWQAVVTGDASVALPAFFPEAAYLQVKAVTNPDADWRERLVRLYDADIAALHARLAGRPGSLVGVAVPGNSATWVLPGAEYNKGSYWRVYGTVVHYTVEGQPASFEVQSLISWRGQWYVVHLATPPVEDRTHVRVESAAWCRRRRGRRCVGAWRPTGRARSSRRAISPSATSGRGSTGGSSSWRLPPSG
jgi:hypothetical protein